VPDLLDHFARMLSAPTPRVLVIKGPPGAGKSTFIRSLAGRLKGPRLFLMHRPRSEAASPGSSGPSGPEGLSLLLIDPEGTVLAGPKDRGTLPPPADADQPLADGEAMPPVLAAALAAMARKGNGYLFCDSWDRATEAAVRATGPSPRSAVSSVSSAFLCRERLGDLPVHAVAVLPELTDEHADSIADGVVELHHEKWEGPPFRVVSLTKIRWDSTLDPQYIYSLEGGQFRCRTQSTAGLVPPVGPPDSDPLPEPGTVWPGSQAFAGAFGRLPFQSLTGIELPPGSPNSLAEVFSVPLAAHALRSGGRVIWVPSVSSSPAQVIARLTRSVPSELIRDRLRILSASGYDSSLGDMKGVILPVRTEVGAGQDLRSATARPVSPLFPDAYQFLRGTEPGMPAIFLLSFDGLRALSAVSGVQYDVTTFPLVVSSYVRLPGFHGFGVGTTGDPLTTSLIPSLGTHIRVVERYGRILVFGVHPTTGCFMLDWMGNDERYSLVRVS
jgi:hypothetical protein